MSDLKKMLPTDFFDIYLFQLREPQILKRSMWVQYARSKMLNFLGGGVTWSHVFVGEKASFLISILFKVFLRGMGGGNLI